MIPQHRWKTYPTSIFSIMSAQSKAVGAVSLAEGFRDFNGPDFVRHKKLVAIGDAT